MNFIKNILIVSILLLLTACKEEKSEQKNTASMPPPAVEIITVTSQNLPLEFTYSGRTQGSREVEVRARVKGILLSRNYKEGSYVKEGEPLFRIDPAPYQAVYQQALAGVVQAKAKLNSATLDWNRIQPLFDQQVVSAKTRDDTIATLDIAKANLSMAEAELNTATINLNYTLVKAPISGVTSMETKSEGSLVDTTTEGSLLTTISQLDPIYVIFAYPDTEFFRQREIINQSGNKNLNLEADIIFNDDSTYSQKGVVDFTSATIDRNTGTVKARAVFPNSNKDLLPGQFVKVVLKGINYDYAITIPEAAVMQGPQGKFVYTVDANNIAKMVPVTTGLSVKGNYVVEEGLNEGDKVIVSGVVKVKPGSPVVITKPATDNQNGAGK